MSIESINQVIKDLKVGNKNIYIYGLVDQATGLFVSQLSGQVKRPVFVVLENEKKARDLYENFTSNKIDSFFIPELTPNFLLLEDLDYTNRTYRMEALVALLEEKPAIYISSWQSLSKKILDRQVFKSKVIEISLESEIDQDQLIKSLVDLGYQRRSIVQAKGEFSVRGDIIDIYQVGQDKPSRIELFDIEVDSIRSFDVSSQLSTEQMDSLNIYPLSENLVDFANKEEIIKLIRKDLAWTRDKMSGQIYDRANSKFEKLIEELEFAKQVSNTDLLIPYIDHNESSILDYLPEESLLIFDDISNQMSTSKEMDKFRFEEVEDKIAKGELLKSHRQMFFEHKRIFDFDRVQRINISGILKSTPDIKFDKVFEIKSRESQNFHGNFKNFINDLDYKIDQGYTNIIFVPDKKDLDKLKADLFDEGFSPLELDQITFDLPGKLALYRGQIQDGFEFYLDKINIIAYEQIYKKAHKTRSRTVKNKEIINYVDLVKGDLLVHDNYGIGEYVGIKNIELNGIKSDFIELSYNNGDKLFVPTGDMSMVSKFIGNADKKPKLSNLNGSEWRKSKAKAKRAIEEIAEDLVRLYAERSQIDGFAYSPDSVWQKEFEDAFPYAETSAQLRAVSEIKGDMESKRVMDRLLAGDVGYGKTEVALRAAFKAIMDSKQVVMLAPTTILVKQHFKTMQERFKDFPIKIDYLSRFKTPAQKAKTLEDLRKGKLDFVVGTHSLLTDKIQFKNLGLLIIDEEQRFGVKHKEKIKEISSNIDVLTLSATPIPRTLQMSLSGIREMSLLDEYPQNRLPVNTYVMEYDPIYIREAILKEMARGGQIYFVYNKVSSISRMHKKLMDLVPEARIAVSHGQMSTRDLENILEDFSDKRYDILLTTTIIETGMDIQNVNTIIVYNADMMGLSQLYQLKGRVGRSDRNAYAYFTFSQGKVMTEIAEKRLKAIKDFTELGSGYKVAMRDLELRGAGNLLGESQSGHIESIGYDLYVRMLKEKIDEIKGIKHFKPLYEIKIDLNLDVYIPDDYIDDENEKINMYKKISYIENSEDHYLIIDELTDRFGDMPKPVQNIVDVAYIKALMLNNNFSHLQEFDSEIKLRYTDLELFDFDKLKILAESYKGHMRFDMVGQPSIFIANQKNYTIKLIELLEIIDKINKEKL